MVNARYHLLKDARGVMPYLVDPHHQVYVGISRSGKTRFIIENIMRSFDYDKPCTYLDLKGDGYPLLLALLAGTEWGRRVYQKYGDRIYFLNPVSPSDYILGFNAIEPLPAFKRYSVDRLALTADSMTAHIRRQSGFGENEAPRMQMFLAAGIGALVEGGLGKLTIAEFPFLFQPSYTRGKQDLYNPFVASLLERVTHLGTRSFWGNIWPTMNPNDRREWSQSSYNRIFQYIFDKRVLFTTCTVKHARLDIRDILKNRCWLFANLPYALLSEEKSTLIASLLLTKFLLTAFQIENTQDYRVYVEEARLVNNAPIDKIMETSGSAHLWLSLSVQGLNQLCRSRDGRIDEGLKETVKNNARYWAVFYNSEDASELAELMFPLTGTRTRGIKANGDLDYKPPQIEENENARRFLNLPQRHMVLFDKWMSYRPYVWVTPETPRTDVTQGQIERFEKQHLMLTGVEASRIEEEIEERWAGIKAMARRDGDQAVSRSLPPSPFGGAQ